MQSTAKIKRTFIVPEVVKKDESWVDPTRLCHPPKSHDADRSSHT